MLQRVTSRASIEILSRLLATVLKPASILLQVCLLPLVMLAFSHVEIIDDAYLSYRYARNLVEGKGLVFNPGERVEGVTNLLWTLMMAVPETLGLRPDTFAAFLGLAFGLLALVGTWLICRRLGVSPLGTAVAVTALGLYPDFWLSITNGLEGGLVAFLLACTVYFTVSGKVAYAGLCGGLLFMTRPDTLLTIPICTLYLLVASRRQMVPLQQRLVRPLFTLFAPWFVLVAAITLWRLAYYGALLPNTITAKSIPLSDLDFYTLMINTLSGLRYWLGFLVSAATLTFGAALALITEPRRPAIWLCLAIVATQVPVVLINGGDWMPHFRLLTVYAPLLAILLSLTADRMAGVRRPSDNAPLRPTARAAIGALLVACGVFTLYGNQWDATPDFVVAKPEPPCWQALGAVVRPALLPMDRVSPEAMGIFSYMLPDVYTHDLLGLTDRYVARHGTIYTGQFGKAAPAYTYYTVRPNLIVVHSGFFHLAPMARASTGRYNTDYSTYLLTEEPACKEDTVMISIRQDSVARILPVFEDMNPQRVVVPLMFAQSSALSTGEKKQIKLYKDTLEVSSLRSALHNSRRIHYEEIAQVAVQRGIIFSRLRIESRDGEVIAVDGLSKENAQEMHQLINERITETPTAQHYSAFKQVRNVLFSKAAIRAGLWSYSNP